MILRKSQFALAALAIVALGCSSSITDGTVCLAYAAAGITLDVRDSVTNALAGRGARIVAREGAFADSSIQTGDGPFGLVFERAGTYTVTVDAAGYRTWSQAGVVVTKGTCHVNGVQVVARLQR